MIVLLFVIGFWNGSASEAMPTPSSADWNNREEQVP
jgi:hypothetical protein